MRRTNNNDSVQSVVVKPGSGSSGFSQNETLNTSSSWISIESPGAVMSSTGKIKTQNAVYNYILALRALGRTRINTAEIAESLSLPVSDVHDALAGLKKKGVRVL
jgi:hypothetical protein